MNSILEFLKKPILLLRSEISSVFSTKLNENFVFWLRKSNDPANYFLIIDAGYK